MSERDLVAVFDVGKTTAKVIVADPGSGEAVWSTSRPTPGGTLPYRHIDAVELEAFLIEALSLAPECERIGTIVPVAHGACAALVAGDTLALPVIDYEEPALEEIAAAYAIERDAFSETFSPHLPLGLNLGRQLAFLEERHPEEFRRTDTILLWPQYWSWRLSGTAASEVTSLGTHTDLWLPLEGTWSGLASRRGWAERFPPIRRAAESLGHLRPDIAERTGLASDVTILCGIHDSNASFLRHLGQRDMSEPFAVVSTGTWIILLAHGAPLDGLDESRDLLANVNAYGGPVPTARFMGGREYAAVAGEAVAIDPDAADLDAVLSARAFAFPSFTPTGGPFQGRTGRVENADDLGPGARAALATLYLALATDHMLDLLRATGEIIVEGPLSRNPLYGRLLAALRPGVPVLCSSDRSGTLGGALVLAGAGRTGLRPQPCAPLSHPALDAYRREWTDRIDPRP